LKPTIAIFDAGKTNKKLLLFDEQYRVVHEQSGRLEETTDEDGDPCEDVDALSRWVHTTLGDVLATNPHNIAAVNFTSYGASFVHLDEKGAPLFPLYNYLKPFPGDLRRQFFEAYGGEKTISRETASPVLGHLNSGLLLYRLKYQRQLLQKPGYSLHLPQYLSYLVTGKSYSDITSIGCHTMLWDFERGDYHRWVSQEGIMKRLARIFPSDEAFEISYSGHTLQAGIGLHDSSSALIPYLQCFDTPFVLISTGTWSISMNPFNSAPLTDDELEQDCLCYMTYQHKPVKSSRLFAGHMHEEGVKAIAEHFSQKADFYGDIRYNQKIVDELKNDHKGFDRYDLARYEDHEEAYHALMYDILNKQVHSTNLIMSSNIGQIFVDGGFGKNPLYMKLLAASYPHLAVYAASVPQATSLGAALALHRFWNSNPIPEGIVQLNRY